MFLGAALYNLLWGTSAVLFPLFAFTAIGAEPPRYPPLVQCIGMMVAVYAVGYFLLFKDPLRYAPLVWVGVLGKTFGPIGFVWSAWSGQLPWDFGWHLLLNDLIWLPGFWLFAWKYARRI